ncbi:tumor necrosis factor ligand superfamily member 14 [Hyla sarda]|uniref:tumor necrosis factor ligand superfamily member 14 n=1 Tax=Hyla sarda TaxID=327740 RepID=UPI0024C42B79|nr:tumor necrosis factor ligand superfamily member 14 [Hyla sarda]
MDKYGRPPMSVFTVEDYIQPSAPSISMVSRKSGRGTLLIQAVLLFFSLLALCGAASEIYYLMKVESSIRNLLLNGSATQGMIQGNVPQKMIFRPGFRDGPPLPSAHVTGLVVGDPSSNSPLEWEHTRGLAFLHEVEYNNGSLVCSKSGLYFIYSKLQLGSPKCPKDTKNSVFSHQVLKRSLNSKIPMIESIRRFCDIPGSSTWRGSSFLGGTFMLAKGNEVYVSMSHKNLIRVQGDTMTFFGMFMVSTAFDQ